MSPAREPGRGLALLRFAVEIKGHRYELILNFVIHIGSRQRVALTNQDKRGILGAPNTVMEPVDA